MSYRIATLFFVIIAMSVLSGCARTGSRSPDARPVLYPNAAYKEFGEAHAQDEVDLCISAARRAGLTPDEKDNAVGHSAAKGAAVVGTAATVGALVRGRGVDSAIGSGVRGAAVGGATGAVVGAFQEKPNTTYRNFVQRCMREKGFDVIGWQ